MDESGGVVADGDGFGRLDGIDTRTERKVNVEVRVRRSLNRNCVGLFCRTCSAKGEREKLVCEVKLEGKRGCPMLEEIVPSRGSLSRVEGVRLMSGVVILTSRG